MIDLRTLGGAEVHEEGGGTARPIAMQAKRLALLTYLATAGPGRQRRRDAVVAMFWPDLDDEHARGALRQSLSYLRRSLGGAVVTTRGEEEIAIAPEALRCDARLFDDDVAAGRLAEAMARYGGDFLDGLNVSDAAPELDRWIDAERSRLRQTAARCAWTLAAACRDGGDYDAAATWGRRGLALDADDEVRLRWLLELLDSIGDRAGAMQMYESFARRLSLEYSAEPSAETQRLMQAMRAVSASDRRTFHGSRDPSSDAEPSATDAKGDPPPAAGARDAPVEIRGRRRRTIVALGATAVLLGVLGSTMRRFESDRAPAVAVLPVSEVATSDAQPYMADALTEWLIGELARTRDLRVVDRRTMMRFRDRAESAPDVARELSTDLALTTELLSSADSVHLAVRLVRAGDGAVMWAWNTVAPKGDLLRVARQIADSATRRALGRDRAEPRAGAPQPRRVDPVALDLYVRARYWWNRRGPGLLRSVQLYGEALEHDPTFARAYAGMADAYVQLGYGSLLPPDDAFPKARAAAERALALDPSLAEPHAALGLVALYYDWDWPGAERALRRAIDLDAGYATAHEWYGLFLAAMGRFAEAREQERRAQALDPLSVAIAGTAAWVLYYEGRPEEAERELRIALRMDSSFALGHFYLGRVHQARGRPDSALANYRAAGPLQDWVPTVAAMGHVYGTQGRRREAEAILSRLDSLSRSRYVTAYGVALVHAALGQRDSAFAWLDRGFAERTHWMVWLRQDPRWAPIRSDPRFEALASRVGLPR